MKLETDELDHILRGWHTLSMFLNDNPSLDTCNMLFDAELQGKKREHILTRLTSRIATLTAKKAKEELNARIDQTN